MKNQTILSGIRPSGILHIGNYLGALKQWVELQNQYRLFAMIADLHAITTPIAPEELREDTLKTAAFFIACGINPKNIFVQSHVPAHAELAWILNTITPVGELERMTQFKEKREDAGALAGLLNYPVLQSADVLLYQADLVPVGEDQLQHLEFTRTLARKFNNRFGKIFKEPGALAPKEAARIMGLDDPTKKMSKSAPSPNNFISLIDSPEEIRRKIKIAVTDSGNEIKYNPETKPAISNLMAIHSALSGMPYEKIEAAYRGKNYAEFKRDLGEIIVQYLSPVQKKYYAARKNEAGLLKILRDGAVRAKKVAQKTLEEAKSKVGFLK